ncbi:MAG: tetratricopeptide repeat protein, partial [Kofleriaceae bacterium]
PIASSGPSGLQIALGALGLAALVASVVRLRGRSAADELRAAAAVWLLGWLPVSHLILPLNMVAVADRYAMLMSLGFALAAAAALARIPARGVRAVAVAAFAILAAVRSYDAQSKWASSILLWERATESDPASARAWSMLAEAFTDLDRPDLAQAAVTRGLAHTQGPRLLLRQAILLADRGDRAGALPFLRRAAEGGEPRAMSNLALLELEGGRLDEALAWARRGAAADPQLAHTQRTRGKVALAAHQLDEAYEAFRVALRLESAAPNRLNLALALLALDRAAEAIPLLEATAADPALGARARALLVEARRRAAPVR